MKDFFDIFFWIFFWFWAYLRKLLGFALWIRYRMTFRVSFIWNYICGLFQFRFHSHLYLGMLHFFSFIYALLILVFSLRTFIFFHFHFVVAPLIFICHFNVFWGFLILFYFIFQRISISSCCFQGFKVFLAFFPSQIFILFLFFL